MAKKQLPKNKEISQIQFKKGELAAEVEELSGEPTSVGRVVLA